MNVKLTFLSLLNPSSDIPMEYKKLVTAALFIQTNQSYLSCHLKLYKIYSEMTFSVVTTGEVQTHPQC